MAESTDARASMFLGLSRGMGTKETGKKMENEEQPRNKKKCPNAEVEGGIVENFASDESPSGR